MYDFENFHQHYQEVYIEKYDKKYFRIRTPIPSGMVIRNGGVESAFPSNDELSRSMAASGPLWKELASELIKGLKKQTKRTEKKRKT